MEQYCVPLDEFIRTLNKVSDFVDADTKDHSRKTRDFADKLGKAMGMSDEDIANLCYGSDIHDLGKIAISPVVFRQPSRLTRAQYASVKQHPQFGYEMISHIQLPKIITDCVLYHHEHWDGSGYPFGLRGEFIPLCARITCFADVWESINSNRPYRLAMEREDAVRFMFEHFDWFDPEVYDKFLILIRKGEL